MADNNPNPVTTRTVDYKRLIQDQNGKDHQKPEVVYQFSNGRKFDSTDKAESGIYRRD